ncbi:hypothetical protein NL529_28040, partial [Klebsiella pneumoniae]|nr:hypothetical protein [Klebsiella pneumoniae]
VFTASRPVRYLGFVISRFAHAETATVVLSDIIRQGGATPIDKPAPVESLHIAIDANRRQVGRAREAAARAIDIAQFYTSVVGDCPYPAFTAA